MRSCGNIFFLGVVGTQKKSVEELGETKLDNDIIQGYQNQPTKTSTDENVGGNRQVAEEYHAASTSLTSVGILHQQVPICDEDVCRPCGEREMF